VVGVRTRTDVRDGSFRGGVLGGVRSITINIICLYVRIFFYSRCSNFRPSFGVNVLHSSLYVTDRASVVTDHFSGPGGAIGWVCVCTAGEVLLDEMVSDQHI